MQPVEDRMVMRRDGLGGILTKETIRRHQLLVLTCTVAGAALSLLLASPAQLETANMAMVAIFGEVLGLGVGLLLASRRTSVAGRGRSGVPPIAVCGVPVLGTVRVQPATTDDVQQRKVTRPHAGVYASISAQLTTCLHPGQILAIAAVKEGPHGYDEVLTQVVDALATGGRRVVVIDARTDLPSNVAPAQMRQTFRRVGASADILLLAAPSVSNAEAEQMLCHSDGVVLIALLGPSTEQDVGHARDVLRATSTRLLGVVMVHAW